MPRRLWAGAQLLFLLLLATPARAEVGAAVSLLSEARLRGYSMSAGKPVGQLDLSYDHRSGFYAGLSATVVAHDGLNPLALQESIGFARKLASGPTIDVGVVQSNYTRHTGRYRPLSYTEVYAGLIGRNVASRVYLSPNYFDPGVWTLYGELDAGMRPTDRLRLTGHVGVLTRLRGPGRQAAQYDWRVGAAHELGRFSVQLSLTGGGPGRDYYEHRARSRTAVVLGVSRIF